MNRRNLSAKNMGGTNPLFFHMLRRPCIETNRVVPSIWQQTRIRSWFSLNGFITYYTVQLTATVIFTPSLLSFLKSFHSSEFSKVFKWVIRWVFFSLGWNSSRAEWKLHLIFFTFLHEMNKLFQMFQFQYQIFVIKYLCTKSPVLQFHNRKNENVLSSFQ